MKYPLGRDTNQSKVSAVREKRIPIKNNGGNSDRPTLANVKPSPQLIGTEKANIESRMFKRFFHFQDKCIFSFLRIPIFF